VKLQRWRLFDGREWDRKKGAVIGGWQEVGWSGMGKRDEKPDQSSSGGIFLGGCYSYQGREGGKTQSN